MARKKAEPIDANKYKSKLEDGAVVLDPSHVTFAEDGVISGIGASIEHEYIDLKSTWISQALIQDAKRFANRDTDGTPRNGQAMRANMREEELREQLLHKQSKRVRRYMEPSGITNPRPRRAGRMDVNYPKQVASPPVNNALNRLAARSRGRMINGRMSLLEHWHEESRSETQIKSESVSSEIMQTRAGLRKVPKKELAKATSTSRVVPPKSVAQTRSRSGIVPKGTATQTRSSSRFVRTREVRGTGMGGTKVREQSSSEESDSYSPPSGRKAAHAPPAPPAPPAKAALQTATLSTRACINCYERHSGCDRSLTGCSSCKDMNLTCVYPNVNAKKSPRKRTG
ncbi:hypothetical protein DID88_003675 [Monilinia fructigena]|uniref:Zn(2)-C6 fungal-type domain-containing protein n=1 Tax=Monilinia fructigena TaxID=38457 RepID=A0A395IU12_9HELO|nr:hypothetical protein DID88_003675 [Monilinia fructigena]